MSTEGHLSAIGLFTERIAFALEELVHLRHGELRERYHALEIAARDTALRFNTLDRRVAYESSHSLRESYQPLMDRRDAAEEASIAAGNAVEAFRAAYPELVRELAAVTP